MGDIAQKAIPRPSQEAVLTKDPNLDTYKDAAGKYVGGLPTKNPEGEKDRWRIIDKIKGAADIAGVKKALGNLLVDFENWLIKNKEKNLFLIE